MNIIMDISLYNIFCTLPEKGKVCLLDRKVELWPFLSCVVLFLHKWLYNVTI